MKDISYFSVMFTVALATMVSCDEHEPFDNSIQVGQVLCADHRTMSLEQYQSQQETEAVAVVFSEANDEHPALAVMLHSIPANQFADTIPARLGTSGSLSRYDGYTNTVAMTNSRSIGGIGSPLADSVFRHHRYGQSDYIPSVAEMRLLVSAKNQVNGIIRQCGGDLLSVEDSLGSCWYWTSTEVAENINNQAWLCSMVNGGIQQTPKDEVHSARAIVALYY